MSAEKIRYDAIPKGFLVEIVRQLKERDIPATRTLILSVDDRIRGAGWSYTEEVLDGKRIQEAVAHLEAHLEAQLNTN